MVRRSVPTVAALPPEQESVPKGVQVPRTVTERAQAVVAEAAMGPGAQRRA